MKYKEALLHYVWRTKKIDVRVLKTTEGETLEILNFGQYNTNAGPDFLDAKIRLDDTIWAGNIEMHTLSSDWTKHQHEKDPAYQNVILHVVLEEDVPIYLKDGTRLPCLSLKPHIPQKIANTYQQLQHNEDWIPCEAFFPKVSEMTKAFWLDRLLIERLEEKTQAVEAALEISKQDWEGVFYQMLARSFGLKVNAEPFEWLAKVTPLKVLQKHRDQLFQLEAILFGQAGLLNKTFEEDYPNQLKKEYQFLKQKYELFQVETVAWKFSRLRPPNFPTIRIAQFAALIHQHPHLMSQILDTTDIAPIFKVELSPYWSTHYVFDKDSEERKKTIGKSRIQLIQINAIAPFLFLYGTKRSIQFYRDKALTMLEQTAPETNSIISQWKTLGMKVTSAYETQALIQLKNKYCNQKRCLECSIGNAIMK